MATNDRPASKKKLPLSVPAPAADTTVAADPAPPRKQKQKRIHGKFSMPASDYVRIARLKATARRTGLKVKKNELLRLGLQALQLRTASELYDLVMGLRLPEAKRRR